MVFAWNGIDSVTSAGFCTTSFLIGGFCVDSLKIPSRKFETLKLLPAPKRARTSGASVLSVSVVGDDSKTGGVKDCGRNRGMESALSLAALGELSLEGIRNKELSSGLSSFPIKESKSLIRGGEGIISIPGMMSGI